MKIKPLYFLYLGWATSLIATMGSLIFSEVMHFPPCVLCWYQRICMYPLVLLLAIGIYRKDKGIYQYALPLSITGLAIAIYHNLLYYKLIPESIQPCINGVSCTTKFIQWFGFITIPFLSLIAFSIITLCLLLFWKMSKK